ncbi:hypothetical protein BCR33DRAFT_715270, partial [Rhizoclosmatium globosum]
MALTHTHLPKGVFSTTWLSASWVAALIKRHCDLTGKGMSEVSFFEAASTSFAEPHLVLRDLPLRAIAEDRVSIVKALTEWLKVDYRPNILDKPPGYCTTYLSKHFINPPPWLALPALSSLSPVNEESVSIIPIQKPALHAVLLKLAACREDPQFINLILTYCKDTPTLYFQLIDEAPNALMYSCEKGHLKVSSILFSLCKSVRPDTFRRCVLSQKVELVRMMVDWYENRFPCNISREIWRRCVELASRDGNTDILELLLLT